MSLSLLDFVRHIHDECIFIRNASAGKTKEQFLSDPVLLRAIVRSLEIIGEATKRIPPSFTAKHPEIEWRKMAATRDVLIHHYFGVDNELVWDIVTKKIPDLEYHLAQIISSWSNDDEF